ncbi:MAG: LysM peptidoglycan-binding domain-containing protein [Leptospiraceae bacterium]|nr:LysM peptidoglycan-binding domain-containing protein [Leptospiraceae bacterium]
MRYVVQDGDTYQRIAAKLYGAWEIYMLIKEYNLFRALSPGMILEIPTPRTAEVTHIVGAGQKPGFHDLSRSYYQVEHFAELLKSANPNVIPREGVRVRIPALVPEATYRAAQRLYKDLMGIAA